MTCAIEHITGVDSCSSGPLGTLRDRGEHTSELSPPLRGDLAGALYPPTPLILSCSWVPYPITPAFSLGRKVHMWRVIGMCGRMLRRELKS